MFFFYIGQYISWLFIILWFFRITSFVRFPFPFPYAWTTTVSTTKDANRRPNKSVVRVEASIETVLLLRVMYAADWVYGIVIICCGEMILQEWIDIKIRDDDEECALIHHRKRSSRMYDRIVHLSSWCIVLLGLVVDCRTSFLRKTKQTSRPRRTVL